MPAEHAGLGEEARVGLLYEVLGVVAGAAQRPGRSIEPVQVVAECVTLELWGHVAWTLSEVDAE